nr:MAG TPA: hypothetical protein [Caudoviricetes sp.]
MRTLTSQAVFFEQEVSSCSFHAIIISRKTLYSVKTFIFSTGLGLLYSYLNT